jgi:outer membrane biosynthesis protein TonB
VETGLVCAGCGALAPGHRPFTPRCPNRRSGDDIDHVMVRGIDLARLDPPSDPDPKEQPDVINQPPPEEMPPAPRPETIPGVPKPDQRPEPPPTVPNPARRS